MALAANHESSFAVREDGILLAWGNNEFGGLGTGDGVNTSVPRQVLWAGGEARARQVSTRRKRTGIVTDTGDLFMCGKGNGGEIWVQVRAGSDLVAHDGDLPVVKTPTLVPRALFAGESVLMVTCGGDFTAVATEAGSVYTFGFGGDGALGHGDLDDQDLPRQVPPASFLNERIVMVSAGHLHMVALSEGRRVYTWGNGECFQLGDGGSEWQESPVQVYFYPDTEDDDDDDDDDEEDTRVPLDLQDNPVTFIAAGCLHTAAVTAHGSLFTWGEGKSGNLGHGDGKPRLVPTLVPGNSFGGAKAIMAACGDDNTMVVTDDGGLWSCGICHREGMTVDMKLNDFFGFVQVRFPGDAAWIVTVTAGSDHTMALDADGMVWTWGSGNMGGLGHGDNKTRWAPTRLTAAGLGDTRIGRYQARPVEGVLAIAMGTHPRLGAQSPLYALAGEVGLWGVILGFCRDWRWVPGAAGRNEGLVKLLGGFCV